MPAPVIGIPARRWNHAAQADRLQTVTSGVNRQYVAAVAGAGGLPVLLPALGEPERMVEAIGRLDGLLLPGAGDVVSLAYGLQPHPAEAYQDPRLDRLETALAREALARGMPLLGICRGIQVLAVACGGTLIQDVPGQVDGAIQHWARPREPALVHTVEVEAGSRLAGVMGAGRVEVNSYHHQAVRDPGDGLRATAHAPDGVIEGLEAADGRPVLAVQCHPEELPAHPPFAALFAWLVEAAGA